MFAQQAARFFTARGIHYGWFIVALTFAFGLSASTAMTVPGVLIIPIAKEFGWTIGDISSAMALRLFLFGAIAPFAGALLVRYGLRNMMMASALLLVAGIVLSITMTSKLQLWLGIGVLLGVAPGLTALVVNATIATRWFTERRGLVMGILSSAIASGQLLLLPVAAWFSERWGWRMALVPTLLLVAFFGVLFALFARNDPADVGLSPYGEKAMQPRLAKPTSNALAITFSALRSGVRSIAFWVLAGTFFVCGLSSAGLMGPHFVPFCADFGIPAVTAAGFLALMGVCDFIGTIGSGWLSDRYDARLLLAWYYGLRGLSLIWLPYSDLTFWGLSAFSVFFGLDYIATLPPTLKIAVQAFGRERTPVLFGWIFAAHQLGGALIAAGAGISRDALATYLPAFLFAGTMCVLAASSMMVLSGKRNPARPVAAE